MEGDGPVVALHDGGDVRDVAAHFATEIDRWRKKTRSPQPGQQWGYPNCRAAIAI